MAKTTQKKRAPQAPLRIATWNINSVRLRIVSVVRFLERWRPDVLCLQETKVQDVDFPAAAFVAAGYPHIAIRGEKSYNGVAIVSRLPFDGMRFEGWAGKSDCRHLTVDLPGGIELHNFYVPAGGDIPDTEANPKFAHKLSFLRHMTEWFGEKRDPAAKRILVGDLNVAPLESDVWSHKALLKVVSHTPVEVELMDALMAAHDWIDAVRHFVPAPEKLYSWWSYRSPDWNAADKGRRLDHIWVTPPLRHYLKSAEIAREVRGWETASDHVPVIITMNGG
jgi:exodeoxyribonuclease III